LIRAGAHAFEGKLFNLVAAGYLDREARDQLASRDKEAGRILDASPRGISVAIGPSGTPISEIQQEDEGLLYADVDLALCVEPKQLHDLVGGYNRFDIFQLTVDRRAQRPVRFHDNGDAPDADADTLTFHS
ncbi:MAG: carbon-nitrogen hydrolase family protein, partial [Gimesia chilikensis]